MKTDIAADRIHETRGPIQYRNGSAITRVRGKWIGHLFSDNQESFRLNLDYATFMQRYAEGYENDVGPLAGCTALRRDDWEWRRRLRRMRGVESEVVMLCCPEDVSCSDGRHAPNEICEH